MYGVMQKCGVDVYRIYAIRDTEEAGSNASLMRAGRRDQRKQQTNEYVGRLDAGGAKDTG
jgi:hypothetical protein